MSEATVDEAMTGLPGAADPQGPLRAVLVASQSRGFLGSGDIERHIIHAEGFSELLRPGQRVLDLGSGGGLPGLVLAWNDAELEVTLLDAANRRIRFLRWAVEELSRTDGGFAQRTGTLGGRAEDLARRPSLTGRFDAVVARLFGRPAVVAECGRRFVREGGLLIVSEPPEAETERWPVEPLRALGWAPETRIRNSSGGFVGLRAIGECPDQVPRRPGVPERRARF